MRLEKMMTLDVETVQPFDSVETAAQKMRDRDVGLLPIMDGNRLVGVISDRDIAVRGIAEGKDPKTTQVQQLATTEVIWCYHDQELDKAARLMQDYQIRRLVILDRGDQTLVGIVSLGDLARHAEKTKAGQVLEKVSAPVGA